MRYLDISRTVSAGMKKYPTDPSVEIDRFKSLDRGDSCNLNKLTMGSHAGTHVDAPLHMFKKGAGVGAIRLEDLICDVCVVDAGRRSKSKFLKTADMKRVTGVILKNAGAGLTVEGAKALIRNGIKVVGTDQMSIEDSSDKAHPVHRLLLGNGVAIIEDLDLRKARPGHCRLICLPLKIKNGDGAPARAALAYD